ncbi:MAG: HAMP domain-containing sensor histidine kinase [Oscillospiraceae bacterium]|nr:HAMP domain-containing sensor histidine kinase [Oscillospiraceae bacterium]
MFSRRSSGLFRKYFLVTISIILASFVFIGGALLLLVSKLWMDEKINLLTENSISVAQNTSDVLESDYLGESGRGSVIVICNTLMQISNAIEADCFITNINGDVVYCKEILQSNMALYTGNCMVHNQYKIPKEIMNSAVKGLYRSTGDLGGSLNSIHFVVAAPVVVNDEAVAVVFATQPVVDGLTPYVAAIFKMFFIAALFALALTFVLVYLVSYRLTKPLREMSAAAKQYATGDFSKRINIKRSKFRISGHDEIDELVQAFNTMAQALATLEMSRRSFVANVSHELKTPMTTIGGFIDGILDGTIEKEKETQYLKVVSDEVKRLSRLVTGMLNMSKIEAGELDLKPQRFDISEMIFRTMLGFEQLIDNKHIEVRGLDTLENNLVTADKDMINQVVYNLIDNAVKFTPEGGYIEVSSKSDIEKVIIKIRNSGKGIPSEELDKIFERFYKIDKSRSYDVKGAGMGLYIVKTIIELHGGQIVARSEPGEYAEFIFQLPLN